MRYLRQWLDRYFKPSPISVQTDHRSITISINKAFLEKLALSDTDAAAVMNKFSEINGDWGGPICAYAKIEAEHIRPLFRALASLKTDW
jgi:hypothetical protein